MLFRRNDLHWWLAGFILGEFSEPSELSMDIKITLKDKAMQRAFVGGLKKEGYFEKDIIQNRNTVSLTFDVPRILQPSTRTPVTTDYTYKIK